MLLDRSKFLFVFVVLACLFIGKAETAFAQVMPPAGIIGWWAGDGDFRDSSGNGNNATPASGAAAPGFLIGEVGQDFTLALNSTQYASIPDSAAIRPQSLTVEGWGKLDTYNNTAPTFFSKALGTASSDSYVVWYQGTTLHGAICSTGGCAQLDAPSFSGGVWHHVALTFNDPGGAATKNIALYVDGVLVSSGTTGIVVGYDTHPALIGADYAFESIAFSWTGELGEITLYNRALSAAEIQAINNAGINGKTKQAPTSAGANSQSVVNDATITFANVTTAGTTTDYTIDPTTAGTLPAGYTQTGLAYDISTTAAFSGVITECFHIPSVSDATVFSKLKVLHSEAGTLVDKTISTDFTARLVCGRTTSLSPFVIANGLSPTAASVSISGRAVTADGRGISNVVILLTDSSGDIRTTTTDSSGFYSFSDVPAGETYIVAARGKRYTFAQPSQVLNVSDETTEVNFIGNRGDKRLRF